MHEDFHEADDTRIVDLDSWDFIDFRINNAT
jgi:hypothetical protein